MEGLEAAGKSTHTGYLAALLRDGGIDPVVTREPGGTAFAEQVRQLVLDCKNAGIDPLAECLLMFAARRQHLQDTIEPALSEGTWVLCERFTDATVAYQGGGRGVPETTLGGLVELVHPQLQPDLTIYLDVPVAVSLRRTRARGEELDRIETEGAKFFDRVRTTYLRMGRELPRFRLVDSDRPSKDVRRDLNGIMRELLESAR